MSDSATDQSFPRKHRLSGRSEFGTVFSRRHRRECGPLLVYATPSSEPGGRLGLSVSRKVGNSVRRNRIKRRLREAWRQDHSGYPDAYDLVIVVRPHEDLAVDQYRHHLKRAVDMLHETMETSQ